MAILLEITGSPSGPDKLWSDRKRHLGLPISFTKYSITENRLIVESGFFNLKEEEILLYRVADLSLSRTLWQRIFGVGTICIKSSDRSSPHFDMVNVKNAQQVKEMLFEQIETCKDKKRVRTTELIEDGDLDDSFEH